MKIYKKFTAGFVLAVLCTGVVFPQETGEKFKIDKPDFPDIPKTPDALQFYLDPLDTAIAAAGRSMDFDPYFIVQAAQGIHPYFKLQFYFQYRKTPGETLAETALNIIPSLGSWIYGNNGYALLTDLGIVLGTGLLAVGLTTPSDDVSWGSVAILGAIYFANLILFPSLNADGFNQNLLKALELPVSIADVSRDFTALPLISIAF
jgi:hypothetical protein